MVALHSTIQLNNKSRWPMKEIVGSMIVLAAVCGPLWVLFSVVAIWFASRRSSQISRDRGEQ